MGNLSNLYISQSFTSLAHLGTNNALVPGTMTRLEDGIGQSLNISFDGTNISSSGNIFAANLTGSADTGSFMLTGSVSVNVLTFTKADGSTFDLTVSASGSVVPGTISSSAQITAFGFVSSSVTASSLITASFDNGTRNLTFTKGNNTTFAVNIPDVSGSSTLPSGVISGSAQITSLGFVSSSITASSIITASITNDDITFTKGDGSQFTIQVATGSFALSASFAETASISRNLEIIARNGNASTLPAGTVVHITGASGDNPIFNTASYDNEAISANTLGLLRYSSVSGADVQVIVNGIVVGVDTNPANGYVAGDVVYLGPNGTFTRVQPQAPNQIVVLGQVLRAQQNNGSIYVSISNGWELNELHNVQITTASLATGDLLQYESSSYGLWKNKSIVGAGITTTSSFNSYTSSTNSRLTNIESTTASLNTSVSNLNTATASLFTSASLALTTASVSGQTMTFRKGDGTTFNVTLPAGGSGSIDTASFATTGSNSFNGSQTITGSITTTQDITISGVRFGFGNPAGTSSIAIGNSSTLANNTDDNSIAIGYDALQQNTTGERNIGIGTQALRNITGNSSYNTAIGAFALSVATSSTNTFALGYAAMENAVDSNENIAIGVAALYRKKANSNGNTAIGTGALREHYDGDSNTGQNMAFGYDAMRNVTSGSANTAIGTAALRDAGRANENVFIGWISGINTSGSISQNVVIGPRAGQKIAGSSNTIIGHNAAPDMVNGGTNIFIGQGAGALIITGSSNTLIGSIPGVDNWSNVIAIADGSSGIKTKFQSNIWEFTGSVDIQNTLTASLQQGFTYVGNASGRTIAVSTSSFASTIDTASFATTGSNTFTGDQTLVDNAGNFFTISDASGSMMLVAKGFTSASAHLSASAAGIGNIIFKTNSNTADTIISGSSNIFTNANAPQVGLKRYVGGSNNIINTVSLPQISGSMQFSPGINQNYIVGQINMRGPVSSSAWNITSNNVQGAISVGTSAANHAQGIVSGLNISTNSILGGVNIIANRTNTTLQFGIATSQFLGGTTSINANSSSVQMTANLIGGANTINNNTTGSNRVSVQGNGFNFTQNIMMGGNTITASGSNDPGDTGDLDYNANIYRSLILGNSNAIQLQGGLTGSNSMVATSVIGNGLIVTGSSPNPQFASSTSNVFGSQFIGRFNAVDGNRAKSAETIFAVGTGTSTSNRKTGFLIDSASNSFFEGTVNISGSLLVNGAAVGGASFATTGSNLFIGNQTITGSVSIKGNTTFTSVGGNTTNIILGSSALGNATSANNSVAIGENALLNTTTGNNNFALGNQAMYSNTTGYQNVALGLGALYNNTTGFLNVAIGNDAMISCGTASFQNVAIGSNALKIASGNNNFGLGTNALENNTGNANIALGSEAGRFHSGSSNVLVGQRAGQYLTGSANTIIGGYESTAGTKFDNNIILADGVGNVRAQYSGSAWAFQDNIKFNKGSNKTCDIVDVNSALTVSNSLVTIDSIILVTTQNSEVAGDEYPAVVSSKGSGTFTINHNYGGTLKVAYLIINPT